MNCPYCGKSMSEHRVTIVENGESYRKRYWYCFVCEYEKEISREAVVFAAPAEEATQ